ncbi:MAG: hypothetical protein ACKV2V_00680 [Blastocatellia bacterium]
MRHHNFVRAGMFMLGLFMLTTAALAQSSLIYTEAATGQRVEFTPFGTLVFQQQNLVSGAWQISYEDRSGRQMAGYFNSQLNGNVVPVSLTANFPNGQTLATGARLYVRAVFRTADGKMTLTRRFIWDAGAGPVSSALTLENTSRSPVAVRNVITLEPVNPPLPSEVCPYIPPIDGFSPATSVVTVQGVAYNRTVLSLSATTAPMQSGDTKDVPTDGCHGGTRTPFNPEN